MDNRLSYCGLVDARKRASDKDLPVQNYIYLDIGSKLTSKQVGDFFLFLTVLTVFASSWYAHGLHCKNLQ